MNIKTNSMLMLGFLLCGWALLQFSAISSRAAGGKRPDIAIVDIEELTKGYKDYMQENEKFVKFRDDRVGQLQIREYLAANEWDELDAMEAKKNLKPDEEKRLAELRGTSDRRRQLKRELESKVDLPEKDKNELDRIRKIPRSNQVRLEDLNNKVQAEIEAEYKRLSEKLRSEVTAVYDKLGKQQGFSMVLDKAQVQWSTPDAEITNEVLNQLNKK